MFVCFLSFYSLIPECGVGVDLLKNDLCTGAGLYFSVSTEMIIGGSGSFQSVTCHPDTLANSLSAFQPFQIRLILNKHHLLRIEVLGASFLRDLTEAILFLLLTGGFLRLFTYFFWHAPSEHLTPAFLPKSLFTVFFCVPVIVFFGGKKKTSELSHFLVKGEKVKY